MRCAAKSWWIIRRDCTGPDRGKCLEANSHATFRHCYLRGKARFSKIAVAEWVAKPGPMMIDVRIATSVITLPYRRIPMFKLVGFRPG